MGKMKWRGREGVAFIAILMDFEYVAMDCWRLTCEQMTKLLNLGSIEELPELGAVGKVISDEILLRMNYADAIFRCLQIIFPDTVAADEWIHKPNTAALFGGRPAIEKMTSGKLEDLRAVRDYLMSQIV